METQGKKQKLLCMFRLAKRRDLFEIIVTIAIIFHFHFILILAVIVTGTGWSSVQSKKIQHSIS